MRNAKNKGCDGDEALAARLIDGLLVKSNSCNSVPHVRKLFVLALCFSAFLAYNAALGRGGVKLLGDIVRGKEQLPITPTVLTMSQNFASAKQELMERLKRDYGEENLRNMFFSKDNATISKGRTAFVGGDHGWDRIKRKLVMKLLQAVLQQQHPITTTTDARATSDSNTIKVPFVWVTGGNSVAAAHGNLMNESHTAVTERAVSPLWESVGLSFVGRNYGMSAGVSAPEVALCQREMLGNDVDVLLWDYGLTDGSKIQSLELFSYRAALTPSRPALLVLPRERTSNSKRVEIARSLEQNGMTTLYMNDDDVRDAFDQVPDTFGKNEQEINAMPEYVRSFKCDGRLEDGDPYCASTKFSMYACDWRRFRVGWHPGWKFNAVYGTMMALFLVEVLEDALHELLILDTAAAAKHLLAELTTQEMSDYQRVRDSELPKYSELYHENEADEVAKELRNLYYKEPSICHTAQLPAEIRYKGILTETEPASILDPAHPTNAIWNIATALSMPSNDTDQMRLVEEQDLRQYCDDDPLNFDHRDSFFVSSNDDWRHLTIPNDLEMREYLNGEPLKGTIILCTVGCHQFIAEEDLHFPQSGGNLGSISNYAVEMQVNGEEVDSLLPVSSPGLMGDICYVLRKNLNNDGHVWKPNKRGRFQISARVKEAGKYIRFSSFIVY